MKRKRKNNLKDEIVRLLRDNPKEEFSYLDLIQHVHPEMYRLYKNRKISLQEIEMLRRSLRKVISRLEREGVIKKKRIGKHVLIKYLSEGSKEDASKIAPLNAMYPLWIHGLEMKILLPRVSSDVKQVIEVEIAGKSRPVKIFAYQGTPGVVMAYIACSEDPLTVEEFNHLTGVVIGHVGATYSQKPIKITLTRLEINQDWSGKMEPKMVMKNLTPYIFIRLYQKHVDMIRSEMVIQEEIDYSLAWKLLNEKALAMKVVDALQDVHSKITRQVKFSNAIMQDTAKQVVHWNNSLKEIPKKLETISTKQSMIETMVGTTNGQVLALAQKIDAHDQDMKKEFSQVKQQVKVFAQPRQQLGQVYKLTFAQQLVLNYIKLGVDTQKELAIVLNCSQANISQQVRKLIVLGLVRRRKMTLQEMQQRGIPRRRGARPFIYEIIKKP